MAHSVFSEIAVRRMLQEFIPKESLQTDEIAGVKARGQPPNQGPRRGVSGGINAGAQRLLFGTVAGEPPR